MRPIFTTLFFFFFVCSTCAQTHSDSIVIKKAFGGYKFLHDNQPLTMKQLGATLQSNPEASKLFRQAKPNAAAATIFAFAGGFLVGWPLGTSIGGGKPNWELAGIGAGLIVVSIPFSASFNKNAKAAVQVFNQGIQTSSLYRRPEFKLNVSMSSIGLEIRF